MRPPVDCLCGLPGAATNILYQWSSVTRMVFDTLSWRYDNFLCYLTLFDASELLCYSHMHMMYYLSFISLTVPTIAGHYTIWLPVVSLDLSPGFSTLVICSAIRCQPVSTWRDDTINLIEDLYGLRPPFCLWKGHTVHLDEIDYIIYFNTVLLCAQTCLAIPNQSFTVSWIVQKLGS